MARPVDPNSAAALNADQIAELLSLFARAKDFVDRVYLPDVLAVAPFYLDWAGLGEGLGNFMVYGDFPLTDSVSSDQPGELFLPRGVILNRDLSKVLPLDQKLINEYVTHSWYDYGDNQQPLHPSVGETKPNYTGPKPPYDQLDIDAKYSWLKAPRYDGKAMEVGPLARMLVAYASGHERVKYYVDAVLSKLGAGPEVLFSTLGRIAARCIETVVLAEQLQPWTMELASNIGKGDLKVHENVHWDPSTWPQEAMGWGWSEAPRGALGHWVHVKAGKIENYQAIVPSTWNGSPRDAAGQAGAYEASLVGTPVADPEKPVEVLRTIHSFDPCMACAVHVLDPEGNEVTRIQVV
jgi:Ni,Fe-hydrogenase I large subunit